MGEVMFAALDAIDDSHKHEREEHLIDEGTQYIVFLGLEHWVIEACNNEEQETRTDATKELACQKGQVGVGMGEFLVLDEEEITCGNCRVEVTSCVFPERRYGDEQSNPHSDSGR